MNTKEILDIIKKDIVKKKDKYPGRKYYNYKPKNTDESIEYYIKDGEEYSVKTEGKNKIYINYFKMLVTQKIDYILAKKCTYDEDIKDNLKIDVYTMLDKLLLNSSLDSRAWLHLYLFNNQIKYIIVKDNEIIPFYSADNSQLEKVIRYYIFDDDLYAEIWTIEGKQTIVFNKEDNVIKDETVSHYESKLYDQDKLILAKEFNFKIIPFILLENNKDVTSDIEDILNLIVAYNEICSGFIENIEKFQEALLILQGYIGDEVEIKKIMKQIKDAKGASVDADGDLRYATIDIPVEARDLLLRILRDVIFLVGRGVDPSKLAEGTNITNTVIKSRYIQLDFKASDTIKRLIEFYDKFIEFINSNGTGTYDNILEFNKSMLINETEMIDNCIKSLNTISLELILKNHPWVEDVEEEIKKIKAEKKENMEMFNLDQEKQKDQDQKLDLLKENAKS